MIYAVGGVAVQFEVTAGEAQPNLRTRHPPKPYGLGEVEFFSWQAVIRLSEAVCTEGSPRGSA